MFLGCLYEKGWLDIDYISLYLDDKILRILLVAVLTQIMHKLDDYKTGSLLNRFQWWDSSIVGILS